MELILLGLLPFLAFGLFGSNDDGDDNGGNGGGGGGNGDNQILRDGNGPSLQDGDSGNDLMLGAGGPDDLSGYEGVDILVGETGQDSLYGGDDEDLVLGGWGGDDLFGGNGDDVVIGGTGNDELFGGAGNDLLFGSSGADTLSGDAGDDVLIGLDVREEVTVDDLIDFDEGELTSILQDTYGDALTDSDVKRVLTGVVNSNPADMAADELFGGQGSDELLGDNGDTLTGGEGTDAFAIYRVAGDDITSITDFNVTTETLDILVDGPATGSLSFVQGADGVGVRLDGNFVAFLEGIRADDLVAGSIRLQSVDA